MFKSLRCNASGPDVGRGPGLEAWFDSGLRGARSVGWC